MKINEFIILKPYKVWLFVSLLFSLIIVGFSFAIPWANKFLIDEILTEKKFNYLVYVFIFYILTAIVNVLLGIYIPRIKTYIYENIINDLRYKLIEKTLYRNLDTIPPKLKGELITLHNNDVPQISNLVTNHYINFILQIINLLITITIILFIDWRMGLLSVILIPIYAILPLIFKNKISYFSNEIQKQESMINSTIQESILGVQQISIFNKQNWFLTKVANYFEQIIPIKIKKTTLENISSSTLIFYWISLIAVFWFGGNMVLAGSMSIGTLLVLVNCIERIEFPSGQLISLYTRINVSKVSVLRYEKHCDLSTVTKIKKILPYQQKLYSINEIQFKDVHFAYRDGINILKKINIVANKGEKIAIVGPSGVGKSTLSLLLLGFLSPDQGKIIFNKDDISPNLATIRDNIGLMSQEHFVFNASIYDNLLLGSNEQDVTRDRVIEVAKIANAHNFIIDLPNGYETVLGDETALSIGQKQRLSLVRLLLKNPEVVILDEPTSHLDVENSKIVLNEFSNFFEEKIIILITHQLNWLESYDRIYFLKDGEIFESGTHSELLNLKGEYYKFFNVLN